MIPQQPSTDDRERLTLSVLAVAAGQRAVASEADPTLIVPIESAILEVGCHKRRHTLGRSVCLMLPGGVRASLSSAAPSSRAALLTFHEQLFADAEQQYAGLGFDRHRLAEWTATPSLLPRTTWVHEIVHRYVFERYALEQHDNHATHFLEVEIVKEVYFLFRDRDEGADRASIEHGQSEPVAKALAWIEQRLFDSCSLDGLAVHCGASESTLLRAFRREVGSTPAAYWRARKLDEALVFLRAGRHTVAVIAATVGYDNPTSFSHAFRLRFGRPPSDYLPRAPVRLAP